MEGPRGGAANETVARTVLIARLEGVPKWPAYMDETILPSTARRGPLTAEQERQFVRDGYVVVSGLISSEVVRETRAALWGALGRKEDDPSTWPDDRILV